jgi:hypothetical protein
VLLGAGNRENLLPYQGSSAILTVMAMRTGSKARDIKSLLRNTELSTSEIAATLETPARYVRKICQGLELPERRAGIDGKLTRLETRVGWLEAALRSLQRFNPPDHSNPPTVN